MSDSRKTNEILYIKTNAKLIKDVSSLNNQQKFAYIKAILEKPKVFPENPEENPVVNCTITKESKDSGAFILKQGDTELHKFNENENKKLAKTSRFYYPNTLGGAAIFTILCLTVIGAIAMLVDYFFFKKNSDILNITYLNNIKDKVESLYNEKSSKNIKTDSKQKTNELSSDSVVKTLKEIDKNSPPILEQSDENLEVYPENDEANTNTNTNTNTSSNPNLGEDNTKPDSNTKDASADSPNKNEISSNSLDEIKDKNKHTKVGANTKDASADSPNKNKTSSNSLDKIKDKNKHTKVGANTQDASANILEKNKKDKVEQNISKQKKALSENENLKKEKEKDATGIQQFNINDYDNKTIEEILEDAKKLWNEDVSEEIVQKTRDNALKLFRKAISYYKSIENDRVLSADEKIKLAKCYLKVDNDTSAIEYYKLASDSGSYKASEYLALIDPNKKAAANYIELSIKQGSVKNAAIKAASIIRKKTKNTMNQAAKMKLNELLKLYLQAKQKSGFGDAQEKWLNSLKDKASNSNVKSIEEYIESNKITLESLGGITDKKENEISKSISHNESSLEKKKLSSRSKDVNTKSDTSKTAPAAKSKKNKKITVEQKIRKQEIVLSENENLRKALEYLNKVDYDFAYLSEYYQNFYGDNDVLDEYVSFSRIFSEAKQNIESYLKKNSTDTLTPEQKYIYAASILIFIDDNKSDMTKAIDLLSEAADVDYLNAIYQLANIYHSNNGLIPFQSEKSKGKSKCQWPEKLFKRAANQKHQRAIKKLELINQKKFPADKNNYEKWYDIAIDSAKTNNENVEKTVSNNKSEANQKLPKNNTKATTTSNENNNPENLDSNKPIIFLNKQPVTSTNKSKVSDTNKQLEKNLNKNNKPK